MGDNIGYHTRLCENNSVKVSGGSFGGDFSIATINRLAWFFTVVVKPSGFPVFVDREGREVSLYITVDPRITEKGKEALMVWREKQRVINAELERIRKAQESEIQELLDGLCAEEIIRRLKAEPK